VKDYGQTDWERNILWRKHRYFLVVDSMRAGADQDYDFRALWRVIGDVDLEQGRLTVRQQDRRLEIANLDGAVLSLAVDAYTTAHWNEYAHAGPVVTILQQDRSCQLQQGAVDVFLNILHPYWEHEAPLVARRVDQGSVLVQEAEGLVWLGASVGAGTQPPCQTDAVLWAVTATTLSLVCATQFGCESPLFQAEHPVDIEFDLSSGQGVVEAALPTLFTLHGLDATDLQVDGMERALRRDGDSLTFSVPPGRHRFALALAARPDAIAAVSTALAAAWDAAASAMASEAAETPAPAPVTAPLWQVTGAVFSAVAPVHSSAVSLLAAGTDDGQLWLLDGDGEVRWRRTVSGKITAVAAADFGGDSVVVAGSTACTVTAFSLSGEQLWQFQVPFYKRAGIVRVLLAADLDGDGQDEVIAGAENWHYYVLDQQGHKRWQFESVHASTAGVVADIDNDGAPELIAATEYYWWFAVSNQGQKKWQHNTVQGPGVVHVATAAQPDGAHLVAFGCRDGTLQVVDAHGQLQFVLRTADTITGLAAADIDGDGAEEFLVASAIQNTYAVKRDGSLLWRVRTGTKPTQLLVDRGHGVSRIGVAEEDGHLQWLDGAGKTGSERWLGEPATALALLRPDGQQAGDGKLLVAALPNRGLCAWRED
jgi:outer membrane protein assembly factor BamB